MIHINVMTPALRRKLNGQRWIERNPDKRRLVSLGWVNRNREYNRKFTKLYNRTNAGMFTTLRGKAKLKGETLSITRQEFYELRTHPCFYCNGQLPETGYGIDRIDSNLGYIPGNCRPCCTVCNFAKNNMTEGEFKQWALKLYSHWLSKPN